MFCKIKQSNNIDNKYTVIHLNLNSLKDPFLCFKKNWKN